MIERAKAFLGMGALLAIFPAVAMPQQGGSDGAVPLEIEDGLPKPVQAQHFSALMESSPFTRSLNLSDSLILTGVAVMDGKQVATLMNKQTKETYVVSDQPNIQGWKMVEYAGDEDLEKVAAKISVAGGEVVTVRYDDWSLKPGEARPAGGGGGEIEGRGSGGRSRGKGPPSEIFNRIRNLSEEQRGKLFEKMREIREKNPNLSREEMRPYMEKMLNKMEGSK